MSCSNCVRSIETTDNAYIRCDITPISSKVSGYVTAVLAEDNAEVAAGAPLVRIEDHEFQVRLEHGRKLLEERRAALVGTGAKPPAAVAHRGCGAQLAAAEAENCSPSMPRNAGWKPNCASRKRS